jgi:D-mannonate dehydratase
LRWPFSFASTRIPSSVYGYQNKGAKGIDEGWDAAWQFEDEILRVLAGFGVNYICSRLPSERLDERWSVEGLSRLRERIESFGLVLDVGSRRKIFNVHFRNIRGGFLNFQETFIDDGDVDMLKAMRVYKEVRFDGMMMPDHVPKIEGDANSYQAFVFAFGYIKALIAAVAAES